MSEQSQGDTYLAWFGKTTTSCTGSSVADLDGSLKNAMVLKLDGTAAESTNPFTAGLGTTFTTLLCGSAYYMQSVDGVAPYTVSDMVASNLDTDAGKISLAYPESVSLPGDLPGAGVYKMTTTFKANKPTYKNGDWWMWWDGSNWVISTPGMDKSGTEGVDYHVGPVALDGSVDIVFPPVGVTVPGGALYTEDVASVLAVEDLAAVITTEG